MFIKDLSESETQELNKKLLFLNQLLENEVKGFFTFNLTN